MALPTDTTHIPSWRRWRWVVWSGGALVLLLGLGLLWKFVLPQRGASQDPAIVEAIAQARASREAGIELEAELRKTPGDVALRLSLARLLLDRGDPFSAAIEAQKALKTGAAPAEVLPVRVQALVRSGNLKQAEMELAGLGNTTEAHRLRGEMALARGEWAAAQQAFRQALALSPAHLPSLLGLAEAQERSGDGPGAKASIDRALKADPRAAEARVALGVWQTYHADRRVARATLLEAARLAGESGKLQQAAAAWVLVTDMDFAAADARAADVGASVLMRLMPGVEAAEVRRARADLLLGKPASAEERLRRFLRQNPESAEAKLYLGLASRALGKPEAARMYLASAANSPQTEQSARRVLGRMLLANGQAEDVVRLVGEAENQADSDLMSLGGRASLLTGDTEGALAYFRRSAAAAPQDVQRQLDLARALLDTGKTVEALALIERLELPTAQEPERQVLRTAALVQAGKLDDARAAMRTLAANRPSDPDAQWLAARGFVLAGDPAGARDALRRVTTLTPKDAAAFTALGLLEVAAGDLAGAERSLQQSLALAPRKPQALFARAHLAVLRDDAAAATSLLEQVVLAAPQALAPRRALVRLALAQRDVALAGKRLKELREVAPANAVAVDLLEARWTALKGDDRAALVAWQRLAEGNPRDAGVQAGLADALLRAGRLAEARKRVRQALEVDPANAAALTAAGDLAMRGRDFRAATEAYDKATTVAPTRDLAVRQFAAARAQGARDADQALRRWLERRPGDITVRLALAGSLEEVGKLPEAMAELQRVLKERPGHPGASNNLAWLKLRTGDVQGALPLAKAAVDAAPAQFEFVDTYASTLARAGRKEEARRLLLAAQSAQPRDARYAKSLADLK